MVFASPTITVCNSRGWRWAFAAANAHLHPLELQTVVVGDAKTIQGTLAEPKFGELLVHNG